MTKLPADAKVELAHWLNAFKADPFSTGADKVDRLCEVFAVLEQSDAEQEQGMGVPFGTGSRASHEALRSSPEASIPNAVDTARRILRDDAYLVSYLLGWCGLGKAEPWGAAMSFALEVAHGYGLIRGESDSTPTEFGAAVAAAFEEASAIDARQSQDGETRLGPKGESAAPQEDAHTPQVDKG